MTSEKKTKKEKHKNSKKNVEEEPEIYLSQIPTSKPKSFTSADELNNLKSDKTMDVKVFKNDIRFYSPNKKKAKRTIAYKDLKDVELDETSPEVVRLIVNAKGKNKCYQLTVSDDGDRRKLCAFLRKHEEHKPQAASPANQSGIKASPESSHRQYVPRNTAFASSDISKDRQSNAGSCSNTSVHYEPSDKSSSTKMRHGLTYAELGGNGGLGFDRRSRSTGFDADYDQDGNDFDSNTDQLTRGYRHGYAPSRQFYDSGRPASSFHGRSRFSYEEEPQYVDDDYESQTSGYGDYESDFSDETIIARPVKPRSLTFYTPFLKVPQNDRPYY
ncbi:unnamed protein product [Mesocestoides corti]|uniref:PID domain-containing protein n=1 Tax=Mesocestoides corti TaxID=53468 RepID=A0A0R3UCJ7_MESCO|nr:unnamed protein product [Mesocestoides corti]